MAFTVLIAFIHGVSRAASRDTAAAAAAGAPGKIMDARIVRAALARSRQRMHRILLKQESRTPRSLAVYFLPPPSSEPGAVGRARESFIQY